MTLGRLAGTASLAAAMLFAAGASAQTPPPRADNLDLTMVLLPENATGAQEIARRIELPPAPPARRNDDARGEGNGERRGGPPSDAGNGRDTAAEARERGREFGQDVSDRARDNRENASRGGNNGNGNGNGPPDTPGGNGPPDAPGPPDSAGPPSSGGPNGGGPPDSPGRPDPPGRPDDPGKP